MGRNCSRSHWHITPNVWRNVFDTLCSPLNNDYWWRVSIQLLFLACILLKSTYMTVVQQSRFTHLPKGAFYISRLAMPLAVAGWNVCTVGPQHLWGLGDQKHHGSWTFANVWCTYYMHTIYIPNNNVYLTWQKGLFYLTIIMFSSSNKLNNS